MLHGLAHRADQRATTFTRKGLGMREFKDITKHSGAVFARLESGAVLKYEGIALRGGDGDGVLVTSSWDGTYHWAGLEVQWDEHDGKPWYFATGSTLNGKQISESAILETEDGETLVAPKFLSQTEVTN